MQQDASLRAKADDIALTYAEKYPWADPEALMLYFRVELIVDTLREAANRVHDKTIPGVKSWSVAVLRALYMAPDNRLSHAEIGAQTRVPPGNVTYHVDVLQQEGYVRRFPHETDRRITLVELTDLGRSICDQVMPARARFISDLLKDFSEKERVIFNEFLARFHQAVMNGQEGLGSIDESNRNPRRS
jgi:MarR family 2-MHQ and catechol resistance regulon transcriptional repressor